MVVRQDVPDELKGKDETKGEASLKGHIEVNKGKEETGSSAYVPADATKDKQLIAALDLLKGTKTADVKPPTDTKVETGTQVEQKIKNAPVEKKSE